MGINAKTLNYIQTITSDLDKDLNSARICLLGNLYLGKGTEHIQRKIGTRIAHKYFEGHGTDVVSIDINGEDGALPLDLCKPLPKSIGTFDIIINGGTLEHVEDQDACLTNIHNICRIDGLMFHVAPLVGCWPKHCNYHYSEAFFRELARRYHYSVVDIRLDDYLGRNRRVVLACLRKEYDGD